MKTEQEKIQSGLGLKEQHNIVLILLIINIIISAIFWFVGRQAYDIFMMAVGFGFLIASILIMIAVLLKKYDISLAFSLLIASYIGFLTIAIIISMFFDPFWGYPDPFVVLSLIPVTILYLAGYFLWNLYKGITQPMMNASMTPQSRRLAKRRTKHGLASIIIGFIGINTIALPPVAIALGAIAILFGLKAKRKRDKQGLGGIILGAISIAIGMISLIMFFTIGRHIY